MTNTKENARFKWASIIANFVSPKILDGKHHACPLCQAGKDRFRFEPESENGSYFCSVCGAGSGVHFIATLQGITHSEAWTVVDKYIGAATEVKPRPLLDRAARISRVLKACAPIARGGDVHRYLYSRGLTPDYGALRLIEAKSTSGDSMMVGRFVLGKRMTGLHVTFLRDGKKVVRENESAKKMFALEKDGLIGSAIRLLPLNGGTRLIVAEGIETALSVAKLLELPAWATGSAGLMEKLEVPAEITEVIIAGDKDTKYAGQAAAYALAKRLTHAKTPKTVHVIFPKKMGTDFNDETCQIMLDSTAKP